MIAPSYSHMACSRVGHSFAYSVEKMPHYAKRLSAWKLRLVHTQLPRFREDPRFGINQNNLPTITILLMTRKAKISVWSLKAVGTVVSLTKRGGL